MSEKNTEVKKVYNYSLLVTCMNKDRATLIGNYSNLGQYRSGGKRASITYKCNCGKNHTKLFGSIFTSGAICIDCMHERMCRILETGRNEENIQKALRTRGNPEDNTKIYSRKALEECIIRDEAKLVGSYPLLFGSTSIQFICCCGSETEQQFQDILGRTIEKRELGYCGALCDDCNKERWVNARNKTNLELYGKIGGINQTDDSRQRGIDTCMEKYGVPNANMAEEVKQKKIDTSRKNWGVDNPAQSQEVMEKTQKNAKKYKEFKMPSGYIRKVQGYEPFALVDLLKIYTEEQIKTDRKDVPKIQYEVDGENKYHFPDIFIPHEKKIVEVKSTWTYECKTDNIQLKKNAAEEQGFLYEIWCYDKKGLKVPV